MKLSLSPRHRAISIECYGSTADQLQQLRKNSQTTSLSLFFLYKCTTHLNWCMAAFEMPSLQNSMNKKKVKEKE